MGQDASRAHDMSAEREDDQGHERDGAAQRACHCSSSTDLARNRSVSGRVECALASHRHPACLRHADERECDEHRRQDDRK